MATDDTRSCSIPDCDREVVSRGWCGAHYQRWRKHGDPLAKYEIPDCSVAGCDRGASTRGLCRFHYQRWYRHGDPTTNLRPKGQTCDVEGCEEPHNAKGKCKRHHAQAWRAAKRKPRPSRVLESSLPCIEDDCTDLRLARGLCPKHYARLRATGETKRTPKPRGSRNQHGYRMVYLPGHHEAYANGYAAEHRVVMSDLLGRPLLAGENVHHRNGDKLDNRTENLELWTTHQPKGQRVADKVAYAREILALYGDLVDRMNT